MAAPVELVGRKTKRGQLILFALVALSWSLSAAVAPPPSPSLSNCDKCATTGDCSRAFQNSPGQFCGSWHDQANQKNSCCCSNDATCKVSTYDCKCSRQSTTNDDGDNSTSSGITSMVWVGIGVGGGVFVFACVGGCYCCVRYKQRQRPPLAPVADQLIVDVPVGNVLPMAQPRYYSCAMTPSAPEYSYENDHSYDITSTTQHLSGGVSTGTAAVAGATTGIVVADIATDGFGGGYCCDNGGYNGGGGHAGGGGCAGGGGDRAGGQRDVGGKF